MIAVPTIYAERRIKASVIYSCHWRKKRIIISVTKKHWFDYIGQICADTACPAVSPGNVTVSFLSALSGSSSSK